jgi:hypothetical protein
MNPFMRQSNNHVVGLTDNLASGAFDAHLTNLKEVVLSYSQGLIY